MNLDDLTIGQARELARLFGQAAAPATPSTPDPLVGRYVLVRCYSAGVHTGFLVEQKGEQVTLRDSRRLWAWKAAVGVALSGVAQNGLASGCKVDTTNPLIRLSGAIEVIPCSAAAQESIHGYR